MKKHKPYQNIKGCRLGMQQRPLPEFSCLQSPCTCMLGWDLPTSWRMSKPRWKILPLMPLGYSVTKLVMIWRNCIRQKRLQNPTWSNISLDIINFSGESLIHNISNLHSNTDHIRTYLSKDLLKLLPPLPAIVLSSLNVGNPISHLPKIQTISLTLSQI